MKINPGEYWKLHDTVVYTIAHISNQLVSSKEQDYDAEYWKVLVMNHHLMLNAKYFLIDVTIIYGHRDYRFLTLDQACQLL